MKKLVSVILAAVLIVCSVFALSACGKKAPENYDLVLITDGAPVNDKGQNQSAWDGVREYGDENEMTYRYYQPSLDEEEGLTVETVKKYVELAANGGAKFVVLPGESYSDIVCELAPMYGDVNFLLVDAFPHAKDDNTIKLLSNVMNISFNSLEAGFLAGYASVIDGYTKLGYVGSINSPTSGNYGAGFVQGAAFAADQLQTPVMLDYAEYDNPKLDYDYSFTVKAVYKKIEESKKETFKVKVVDGVGTGVYTDGENVKITANPAPEGKIFDHWEVKSDTEGVKDKKVNISSKTKTEMNLLVGDCDCTITAVWADAETVPIEVIMPSKYDIYASIDAIKSVIYYAPVNTQYWVEAPAAPSGYIFDHWDCADEKAVESPDEKGTNINVGDVALTLNPVYVKSPNPTFDVTVIDGSGTGAYVAGDEVKVVADAPKDGYMFDKWENFDNQGLSTGIEMDNEYNYVTKFEMVDRFASIAETMYNEGIEVVFGGGNPLSDSIFTATGEFDYPVYAYGSVIDEGDKGNCLASVVNDYRVAVKLALDDFKGASIFSASCANGCIYVTGKNLEEFQLDEDGKPAKDKDGNEIKNEDYNANFADIYKALADGKLNPKSVKSGEDVRDCFSSACLTLNYKIK